MRDSVHKDGKVHRNAARLTGEMAPTDLRLRMLFDLPVAVEVSGQEVNLEDFTLTRPE